MEWIISRHSVTESEEMERIIRVIVKIEKSASTRISSTVGGCHGVVSSLSDPGLTHTCVTFIIIIAPGGAVIRDTGDNFRITVRGGNL